MLRGQSRAGWATSDVAGCWHQGLALCLGPLRARSARVWAVYLLCKVCSCAKPCTACLCCDFVTL
jgi:hypothetical protein